MNRATSPDTSCIDIPFLIRGRIVEPTADDSVELGGRVGARFRTPNPLRHAKDLVLSNPGELKDLHDTPIDEGIHFPAELGPRLALDANPLMEAAFRLALEAGELTEPVLRPVYENFPALFDRDRLHLQGAKKGGKGHLDRWGGRGRPRA